MKKQSWPMYTCWLWGSWLSSCYTAIKPSRKLRHPVHYHEWDLSSSGDYNGGKGNEDYGYDDVPLYFFMAKPRDNMQYKVPTSILTLQPLLLGIVGKSLLNVSYINRLDPRFRNWKECSKPKGFSNPWMRFKKPSNPQQSSKFHNKVFYNK